MDGNYQGTHNHHHLRYKLGGKSGVLLSFALGVLGISVARILCTYKKYYVVFLTKGPS